MSVNALQDRVRAIADDARAKLEAEREQNRRDMPNAYALLTEYTRIFGRIPSGRLTENGKTVAWGRYKG